MVDMHREILERAESAERKLAMAREALVSIEAIDPLSLDAEFARSYVAKQRDIARATLAAMRARGE